MQKQGLKFLRIPRDLAAKNPPAIKKVKTKTPPRTNITVTAPIIRLG
jgi:hypothetical protein